MNKKLTKSGKVSREIPASANNVAHPMAHVWLVTWHRKGHLLRAAERGDQVKAKAAGSLFNY